MAEPRTGALAVVFLTVVIDLIGFGMFIPLLPAYAEAAASPAAAGLLIGAFSLFQFLCAPLWGRLSDRIGRRPVLLIGLLGSSAAHLGFALSPGYAGMLAARSLAGACGATIPTAQAYVADVTTPETRAKGMGLIGAAFGIGFVIGPALAFPLLALDDRAPVWFAAGLSLAAFVFGWFRLRESRVPGAAGSERTFSVAHLAESLQDGRRAALILGLVVVILCFAVFEGTYTLLGAERVGFDTRQMSLAFAVVGLLIALIQGGLIHRLVKKRGERAVAAISALGLAAGYAGVAFAWSRSPFFAFSLLVGVSYAGLFPSLTALISKNTPAAKQGATFGVAQSGVSLARFVGHAGGRWAFSVSSAVPYVSAAVLLVLLAVGFRMWRVRFPRDLSEIGPA